MKFDTKIAIVVRADLAVWQQLNVAAFLMSGLSSTQDPVVGLPYRDASGKEYLPLCRQPILVFGTDAAGLRRVHACALERAVPMAIYIEEMFRTGHDEANRAAVMAVPTESLNLVGIGLRGQRKSVDRVLDGVPLHD